MGNRKDHFSPITHRLVSPIFLIQRFFKSGGVDYVEGLVLAGEECEGLLAHPFDDTHGMVMGDVLGADELKREVDNETKPSEFAFFLEEVVHNHPLRCRRELIPGFPACSVNELKEDNKPDTDGNGYVSHVKGGPVISPVIEVEEIHHIAIKDAVVYVTESTREDEAQRQRLGPAHAVSHKYVDEGRRDQERYYGEDVFRIPALVEHTENTTKVPDMNK